MGRIYISAGTVWKGGVGRWKLFGGIDFPSPSTSEEIQTLHLAEASHSSECLVIPGPGVEQMQVDVYL